MPRKRLSASSGVCLLILVLVLMCANNGRSDDSMVLWTINPKTPFGNLIDRKARLFSDAHPGINLISEHFSNDYYKFTLRSAMDSSQPPDIFHNWGGSSLEGYIGKGKLVPLNDMAEVLKSRVIPGAFDPVSFDGIVYGVPYSGLAGVFFWYRKDIFKKFNLTPPRTWEEFLEVGETLKENGIVPITLTNKNKWPGSFFFMYLVDRIGGPRLFNDAFIAKTASFENPAFIRAGELIQELVRRNFFQKGFNRQRYEPGGWNSMIISGQAGMYLMGSWFLSVLKTVPPEIRELFDFFPFPVIEGGHGIRDDIVGSPGQDYLSISADSRNPTMAKLFLSDYICSGDYFRELAELGFVPPVLDTREYIPDPLARKVAEMYRNASHVQRYYDQLMPPDMSEAHKLLIHQLFELRLTPEQVARSHADLLEDHAAPH